MNKIQELRNLLKEMYDYWNKHDADGHHKSQEMMITLSEHYPDYWEGYFSGVLYSIEVYSYIFCEGRRFNSKSIDKEGIIQEAIDYFKGKFEIYKGDLNES